MPLFCLTQFFSFDFHRWYVGPQLVNAFYLPNRNEISKNRFRKKQCACFLFSFFLNFLETTSVLEKYQMKEVCWGVQRVVQ